MENDANVRFKIIVRQRVLNIFILNILFSFSKFLENNGKHVYECKVEQEVSCRDFGHYFQV